MSADIGYAGGAAQDIQILSAQGMPAKCVPARFDRSTDGKARILDTLRSQRPAWRYAGLDNSS
jgi:hypothetical protein